MCQKILQQIYTILLSSDIIIIIILHPPQKMKTKLFIIMSQKNGKKLKFVW